MMRSDAEVCAPPLCIGQAPLQEQQAMRASGVGAQPAQTAALPASKSKLSPMAERRRTILTTLVGCSTVAAVSNGCARALRSVSPTLFHPPRRHVGPSAQCFTRPIGRFIRVTPGAWIGNLELVGHRRRDERERVAADVHVRDRLR